MKMTSNGKTLNYKVVNLVESYNFDIKFTSIRVQTKKLQIFEKTRPLSPWPTAVAGATVPRAILHSACIVLQFFSGPYIFAKRGKKTVKKRKKFEDQ
jgi:hypothetical protein